MTMYSPIEQLVNTPMTLDRLRAHLADNEGIVPLEEVHDAIAMLDAFIAARGEAVAWLAADGTGRVIDAKAKNAGSRAAATGSATEIYSIPLSTAPPAPKIPNAKPTVNPSTCKAAGEITGYDADGLYRWPRVRWLSPTYPEVGTRLYIQPSTPKVDEAMVLEFSDTYTMHPSNPMGSVPIYEATEAALIAALENRDG